MTEINRRKFLTYVGTGAAALTVASAGLGGLAPKVEAKGRDAANNLFGFNKKVSGLNFKPIHHLMQMILFYQKGINMKLLLHMEIKLMKLEIRSDLTVTSLNISQLTDLATMDYFG